MKPAKSAQGAEQGELYQRRLSTLLDQQHPLDVLAEAIDWEFFAREFEAFYVAQQGRPGLPLRLLVGLHYLKHLYDVSDERVVAGLSRTRTGNTSVGKNSSCPSINLGIKTEALKQGRRKNN
jgi:hypothetical protein